MQPLKLSVYIATFSYGGNGGIASEHPSVGRFIARTMLAAARDPRVERIIEKDYCDTPITMVRNRAVCDAKQAGCDLILMIDSDMEPDHRLGVDEFARPFWDEAFTKCYEEYSKRPLGVCVFAPYGGMPPNENPFCFVWRKYQNDTPDDHMKLDLMTREEAHALTGFHEQPAAPTGLILYDMRLFELNRPTKKGDKSWFDYEFTDIYQQDKGSTEDVFQTRNMVMSCYRQYGYIPLFGAFHCWAGHWKKKCVSRPVLLSYDEVDRKFLEAAFRTAGADRRIADVDYTAGLNLSGADMTPHPALPPGDELRPDGNQTLNDQAAILEALNDALDCTSEGAVVEFGCNAGITSLAIGQVLASREAGRRFVVLDSFEALPELSEKDAGTAESMRAAVTAYPPSVLMKRFKDAGVAMPEIRAGWFEHTAPALVSDMKVAFALIDGDLYESIMQPATCLIESGALVDGAMVVVDDAPGTLFPGARLAIEDIASRYGVSWQFIPGTKLACFQYRLSPPGGEPENPGRKAPTRKRTTKPSPAKKRSPRTRPSRKHETNGHADVDSPGELVGATAAE